MSLARKLRLRLTYANVMSSIALFVALSGGAYALSVPKNSVGSRQLRRGAVTSPKLHGGAVTSSKLRAGAVTSSKVLDHSLTGSDLAPGVIPKATAIPAPVPPPVLGGARAADLDPPATPGAAIQSVALNLTSAGQAFVLATLRYVNLTCGAGACQADWGIYVDNQPVPSTGLHLQAAGTLGDGYPFYTLYGLTPSLRAGSHTVTLTMTSVGNPADVGQFGAQLGALALN